MRVYSGVIKDYELHSDGTETMTLFEEPEMDEPIPSPFNETFPLLNFTIGLPRSGKSTFANQWREGRSNRVVLSGDAFRYAVYGQRFQYNGESIVRASLLTAASALIHAGYEVLIDETNTSEQHIWDILNICKYAKAYIFLTTIDVCIERAKQTKQFDLIVPIKRMNNNLSATLHKMRTGQIILDSFEYV